MEDFEQNGTGNGTETGDGLEGFRSDLAVELTGEELGETDFLNPAEVFGTGGKTGAETGAENDSAPYGYKSDGTPRKRPGRRATEGTGAETKTGPTYKVNRTAKEETKTAVDGIAGCFLFAHTILAKITNVEELALSEKEAEQLAKCSVKVASLYNIVATEKQIAWSQLAFCFASVYGPRYTAIETAVKNRKKKGPQVINIQREQHGNV